MTNVTNTTAKKVSHATLIKVQNAALASATAERGMEILKEQAIAACIKAGSGVDSVRRAFKTGYMAGQLLRKGAVIKSNAKANTSAIALAEKQYDLPGKKRTKTAQAAYMASNTAWGRVLAKANVKPADPRGATKGETGETATKTKRQTKTSTANVEKAQPIKIGASAAIPTIATRQDTAQILQAEAAWLTAVIKEAMQRKDAAGHSAASLQMRNLVNDFATGAKALVADSKKD